MKKSLFDSGCITLAPGNTISGGISFKLSNRDEIGFPYSKLKSASLTDGESKVTIAFDSKTYVLRGRRLTSVVQDVVQSRIVMIRVARRTETLDDSDDSPVIETIEEHEEV